MKKIFTILVAVVMTASVFGQTTIAEWTPVTMLGGVGDFGPSPWSASTTDANLTIGGLTKGSGVGNTGTGAANGWGGTDFSSTTLANAITANKFVTFTVTANVGYKFSVTSIEKYNIRRSSSGPTTGQWQYQKGTGTFVNIGSAITWGAITTNAGNEQAAIDLSGITDLQDVPAGTTITFRLVNYGASGTGSWYINGHANATSKTLTIKGNVTTSTLGVSDILKSKNIFLKNTVVDNALSFQTKGTATVKVYNVSGQLVKSSVISVSNSTVDVVSLPKGNYVVTAELNGEKVSQKIIKK